MLAVLLYLWVYPPYLWLQHYHLFRTVVMPATFLDRLIPFSDNSVWLYLSLYLLMPVGPFLMKSRPQIIRYALGIALISLAADVVFVFWPTFYARPEAEGAVALYRLLVYLDNPYHSFPSLHAAFAIYSALCAGQVLRALEAPMMWRGGVWLWTFLILLATLLTKQHGVADLLAGGALGAGAYVGVLARWHFGLARKTQLELVL
jgi:membrane-associated phospholipid phosphatase